MNKFIIKIILSTLITIFASPQVLAQCAEGRGDLTSFQVFWSRFIPLVSNEKTAELLVPVYKFPVEITGAVEGRTISISQATFIKYYREVFVNTPPNHSNKFMEYINELASYNANEHNPLKWKYDVWANDGSNLLVSAFKNGCVVNPRNYVYSGDFHFSWTKESGWKITSIYMPNDFNHIKKFLRQKKALVYEEYGEPVN